MCREFVFVCPCHVGVLCCACVSGRGLLRAHAVAQAGIIMPSRRICGRASAVALPAADAALLRLKGGAKKEKPDGYEAFQPPKRALTAYMIFSNKIRPELMKVCVRGPVVQKLGALLLCSCLILMLPSERRSACICVTGPRVVLRCLIGDVRAVQANPELKITEVSKHIAEKWKVGLVVRAQIECLYASRA